ncbi:thiamine biosynthesis protein ThiI [Natranaerovirga pectinivora]|uniref:Probable tRNA sulfurtransferase n=1 Tax=Natranaerovirga pectinivora TaxID=682400 RepID=A0A4R3MT41_9FIRM|nr:tRNA uracil 4-sulfurtransferase ThiI [Natranaerovirga pectinivora]TCT16880.1 thiamine biosynthesis protein ThiI [Natranaerovirga pectinivora]
MYNAFLVKYGELAIKGRNRYLFENVLVQHIKRALKPYGEFIVKKEQGRIFIEALSDFEYDEAIDKLRKIFGIVGICPVILSDDLSFEAVKKLSIEYVNQSFEEKNFTFKVEARRADKKYPLDSMEISREIGSILLDEFSNLKVDVHKPEVKIMVEIRNKAYIYSHVIPGLGGMPVGTNGKAMLMLSGGIDSPVAGWMIAKRGVAIDAVYYHSHPYTSERAKEKVIDLAKIISEYTGPINLHVVPFTDIQLYIYENCPHEQLTIIMRRVMMQMAERIALDNGALALITGESIGQVASQTIQSLTTTNAVCNIPVFRPLIGFDKQEIVNISEKIGTYETSILPYEDCCTIFVAKHPVTKPSLKSIERSERKLEKIEELVNESLEKTEVIKV